nr:CASP-like protein 5B2 [Ipomoea batatas]
MGLQVLWSFGLACLDAYALKIKRDICSPVLVSLFVVGDWVTSTLSLAAACASAGIAVLYAKDLKFCNDPAHLPCVKFELSAVLAFITWFLIAISSHVMFWILASV